jgi:hypothetical protein
MPRRALMLAALLLLCSAPAFAQRPQPVQRAIADAEAECRNAGGRPAIGRAFETVAELNGDGVPDHVLAFQGFECAGAASFFCGATGCPVVVFLSSPRGYRTQGLGHAQAWRLETGEPTPVLVLSLQGSACGRAAAQSCQVRLGWNGREIARVVPAAPTRAAARGRQGAIPEVKPPPPVPDGPPLPASWALHPIAGGSQIAVVEGPGAVLALTVMCRQGAPVAALALRSPPPEGPLVLSLAGRGGRAAAPLTPGGGPVWLADLRNPALARLLAGDEPGLELRINDSLQGRLSLEGSSRAVRDALGGCPTF